VTLADRLRAAIEAGRLSGPRWIDVARQFGVTPRAVQDARIKLGIVARTPGDVQKTDTSVARGVKPTVQVCAPVAESRWRNLEEFDSGIENLECPDREGYTPVAQSADNRDAHAMAPDGYHVKGVSTLYDGDGLVKARWVKTNKAQDDNRKWILDAIANIAEGWPLQASAVELPKHSDDDLLCVYPMGDPHIGMLAWAPETGENFDLAIAERNLVNAVDHLALLAPPAKRALIATVGDTFHSDGLANTTTKGTRVDVDGRTRKMIDVGVRTFRRVIDRALLHHDEVEVKIAPGNHDALISIFLQVALGQFYENEPRVRVDPSPESFLWYRFGANLLGINHGHLATADALMQAMAVDCAQDWGQTRHRRIYKGHLHHEITKEVPGVTVDTLNTLASSDDWHRRSAYRSTRHMRMDIIHREFGLINRHIVGIEQLQRRAA
jgi:hypothetical protein